MVPPTILGFSGVSLVAVSQEESAPPHLDPALRSAARKSVALYVLARLGLFVVLTLIIQTVAVIIGAYVPIFMSAALALFVSLPLSLFVFRGLRLRATAAIAQWDAHRREYKDWVKRELASR